MTIYRKTYGKKNKKSIEKLQTKNKNITLYLKVLLIWMKNQNT